MEINIFEKEKRVGGRVYPIYLKNNKVELGAVVIDK